MDSLDVSPLADPAALHPALWRARPGGGGAAGDTTPSGFAALDAELPGGGWPHRALTELLLAGPGLGEWRLLAPALARQAAAGRSLMLFDPPAELSAQALSELGLPPALCIVVRARQTARPAARAAVRRHQGAPVEVCWAMEQALRSGQLGALLAWPGAAARPEVLRRLQLAAQAHPGPAFLLREPAAAERPSPAPLRLLLSCSGPDELSLRLLKRRGPLREQPLRLALPPVLSARARQRANQPWPAPARQPQPALPERAGPGLAAVPGSAPWLARLGAPASDR
ncbi:translesion DNA synthesis-associated protein ImuA [Ideonella alba]|uniref:translesion DNA synthesis-associated protein ImuA n=1 Tax=Ideonella alba TaxID=2824118 RepID=UPI0028737D7A|nr:translesion DNA synthesis-associated protein ImuA [Ideonella alba]